MTFTVTANNPVAEIMHDLCLCKSIKEIEKVLAEERIAKLKPHEAAQLSIEIGNLFLEISKQRYGSLVVSFQNFLYKDLKLNNNAYDRFKHANLRIKELYNRLFRIDIDCDSLKILRDEGKIEFNYQYFSEGSSVATIFKDNKDKYLVHYIDRSKSISAFYLYDQPPEMKDIPQFSKGKYLSREMFRDVFGLNRITSKGCIRGDDDRLDFETHPSLFSRGFNPIRNEKIKVLPHKISEFPVFDQHVEMAKKAKLPIDFSKVIVIRRGHSLESEYKLCEAFIKLGVPKDNIFFTDKAYSGHEGVLTAMKENLGIAVVRGKTPEYFGGYAKIGIQSSTELLDEVAKKFSDMKDRQVLVIDDGRQLREAVIKHPKFKNVLLRHVEQTSGGLRRDKESKEEKQPAIANVAESWSKAIECLFIACLFYEACKERLKNVPNGQGKLGVIGLGRIGSVVAEMALQDGYEVFAYDKRPLANLFDNQKFHFTKDQKGVNPNEEVMKQCHVTIGCIGGSILEGIDLNKIDFQHENVLLAGSNIGTLRGVEKYRQSMKPPKIFTEMKRYYASSSIDFITKNNVRIRVKPVGVNFNNTHCLRAEEIECTTCSLFWGAIQQLLTPEEVLSKGGIFKLHEDLQHLIIHDCLNNIEKSALKGKQFKFIKMKYQGDMFHAMDDLRKVYDNLDKISKNSGGKEICELKKIFNKYFDFKVEWEKRLDKLKISEETIDIGAKLLKEFLLSTSFFQKAMREHAEAKETHGTKRSLCSITK